MMTMTGMPTLLATVKMPSPFVLLGEFLCPIICVALIVMAMRSLYQRHSREQDEWRQDR